MHGCQFVRSYHVSCSFAAAVAAAAWWKDANAPKLYYWCCSDASHVLLARALAQVLLALRGLHVYQPELCVCAHVRVWRVHAGDYRSKSACYSWAGATALLSLPRPLPLYLWTKGCTETNDLAAVSQQRRTTDEKGKRSAMVTAKGEI